MSTAGSPAAEQHLPLHLGDHGPAVADLQRRLRAAGHTTGADADGRFGAGTHDAVLALQTERDLEPTGTVDRATWAIVVEAGRRLGERALYHHRPMLRGDDVADLQLRLGSLGFDAGWVDGIFGPDTERALKDFQRNAGLPIDGIAGPRTLAELDRLGAKSARSEPVVRVRERDRGRRNAEAGLAGQRLVVGETGTLGALADATGRVLRTAGAQVLTLHGTDLSEQARTANRFDGDAYVGLDAVRAPTCVLRYFSTARFESWGGQLLAQDLASRLRTILGDIPVEVRGSPAAVLRETRMPALWCELGPVVDVVHHHRALAGAIAAALAGWGADDPHPSPPSPAPPVRH